MTRVLIADGQPRALRSLQALLTAIAWSESAAAEDGAAGIEMVGEAADGQAVIDRVAALHPDVVVMEWGMPELDGATTIRELKRGWPAVRIVVLTLFATGRAAALEAGADVFLLKGCSTGELLAALTGEDGVE